jgi:hypothetical protein
VLIGSTNTKTAGRVEKDKAAACLAKGKKRCDEIFRPLLSKQKDIFVAALLRIVLQALPDDDDEAAFCAFSCSSLFQNRDLYAGKELWFHVLTSKLFSICGEQSEKIKGQ